MPLPLRQIILGAGMGVKLNIVTQLQHLATSVFVSDRLEFTSSAFVRQFCARSSSLCPR